MSAEEVLENPSEKSPDIIKPREPESLKKARRKKIAGVVLGVASGALTVLIIIALLGQNYGNFTIKLEDRHFELALGNSLTNANNGGAGLANKTNYIMADGYKAASPMQADDLPDVDTIDPDIGDGTVNLANPQKATTGDFGVNYDYSFRYTFYLNNTSPTEYAKANYYINFNSIIEPTNLSKSAALEDILRVRVYDSKYIDGDVEHRCVGTFARKAKTFSVNGSNAEPITSNPKREENKGYCTNFLNDYTDDPLALIVMKNETELQPKEIRRYTVVVWLEGNDADCEGENPIGGSLTMAMHFTTDDLTTSWAGEGSSKGALLSDSSAR